MSVGSRRISALGDGVPANLVSTCTLRSMVIRTVLGVDVDA